MLSPIQLELVRLLGKKDQGLRYVDIDAQGKTVIKRKQMDTYQDITLSDFHRYANDKHLAWEQSSACIYSYVDSIDDRYFSPILYDSSRDFLDQEESTLEAIVELVKTKS